jgi:hypothetical protein
VPAVALFLSYAIWTEDTDVFGTGTAVWTSDRIAIFLKEQLKSRRRRADLIGSLLPPGAAWGSFRPASVRLSQDLSPDFFKGTSCL